MSRGDILVTKDRPRRGDYINIGYKLDGSERPYLSKLTSAGGLLLTTPIIDDRSFSLHSLEMSAERGLAKVR